MKALCEYFSFSLFRTFLIPSSSDRGSAFFFVHLPTNRFEAILAHTSYTTLSNTRLHSYIASRDAKGDKNIPGTSPPNIVHVSCVAAFLHAEAFDRFIISRTARNAMWVHRIPATHEIVKFLHVQDVKNILSEKVSGI